MRKGLPFFISFIALLATGCVTQTTIAGQTSGQVVTSTSSAKKQRSSLTSVRLLQITVPADATFTLASSFSVNPDCTLRGINTIRIVQPPTNGTVKVIKRDGYPTFPAGHQLFSCDKIKTPAAFADYTPKSGFTGADFLILELFSSEGHDATAKYSITVK